MYSDEVLIGYQEAGLGILSVEAIAAKARKPEIDGITSFFPGEYDGIWPASPQGFKPKGKEWEDEFVKYIMIGGDLDSLIEDLNARYNALDQERAAGRVDMKAIPSFDPRSSGCLMAKRLIYINKQLRHSRNIETEDVDQCSTDYRSDAESGSRLCSLSFCGYYRRRVKLHDRGGSCEGQCLSA